MASLAMIQELPANLVHFVCDLDQLDELCKTVGVLSDDGDDIVDKYSGMVLRKREFVSGDEYDEAGFRITSHDLIEKDVGTVVMENLGKKEKRVFENETSETIYNVFSTICSNIDINIDPLADFILRVSNFFINFFFSLPLPIIINLYWGNFCKTILKASINPSKFFCFSNLPTPNKIFFLFLFLIFFLKNIGL